MSGEARWEKYSKYLPRVGTFAQLRVLLAKSFLFPPGLLPPFIPLSILWSFFPYEAGCHWETWGQEKREASATVSCACRYTDVARGKIFAKPTNALARAIFLAWYVCGWVNPCSWVISEGGLCCAESSNGGFGQANKPPKQKVFRFSRHEERWSNHRNLYGRLSKKIKKNALL